MGVKIQRYWTNFVKHLDVNGAPTAAGLRAPALPAKNLSWPQFNESHRLNLRIGTPELAIESTLTGQSSSPPRSTGALGPNGVCKFYDAQVGYNH